MDPFAIAAEMLGSRPLSSGQVAQLRAIDARYQHRVFALTRSGPSAERRELTRKEVEELEAMVRADVVAMLAPGDPPASCEG